MARAKALLAHDPLRRWTAADANDTYNIPRWGCGYFGVNDQGNLIVTPRGEGNGAIDMKELDRRARRARHPAADPAPLQRHPARAHRAAVRRVQRRDQRVRLQRPVPRRVPDQGQPEPHRRRGDHRVRPAVPLRPRGRQQARAPRDHGDPPGRRGADHLQRLQGRGVHRDRAARVEDGQDGHPRRREADRARQHPPRQRAREDQAAARLPRAPVVARRRPLGAVRRRLLEVRPVGRRDGRGRRQAQGVGRGRHAQAPPLPPRLADLARSRASRTRCARPAACSSSCTSSARRAWRTSTSAAASASTTTARRRTSRRR